MHGIMMLTMMAQVKLNPGHYGMPTNLQTHQSIEAALKDRVIMSNLRELAKHKLVRAAVLYLVSCDQHYLAVRQYLVSCDQHHQVLTAANACRSSLSRMHLV